jgi:hypothetical protein
MQGMAGYEVVIEAMRSAAAAASSAADQASRVLPGPALVNLHDAMPGARVAGKLDRVRAVWTGKGVGWAGRMTDYASGLSNSADSYAANEASAARDLVVPEPRLGTNKAI